MNGTTLTVTRVNGGEKENPGWSNGLGSRGYVRNEFRKFFESTKYLYHGSMVNGLLMMWRKLLSKIVKDDLQTVKKGVFSECSYLSKITIPASVALIEDFAFEECLYCDALNSVQSRGYWTLYLFLGAQHWKQFYITVTFISICQGNFVLYMPIRTFNIPDSLNEIGPGIVGGPCTIEMQYDPWLRDWCKSFHNLCWNPSGTPDIIQQYIQEHYDNGERATSNDAPQFTPFYLLATNPSVNDKMITPYLRFAPNVAKTPLHMWCSVPQFSDASDGTIRAYFPSEEGIIAAFMKDK